MSGTGWGRSWSEMFSTVLPQATARTTPGRTKASSQEAVWTATASIRSRAVSGCSTGATVALTP